MSQNAEEEEEEEPQQDFSLVNISVANRELQEHPVVLMVAVTSLLRRLSWHNEGAFWATVKIAADCSDGEAEEFPMKTAIDRVFSSKLRVKARNLLSVHRAN